jgi:type II secretory pathway pseudopilin PulG
MMAPRHLFQKNIRGSTMIRLLVFISLMGIVAGLLLPIVLDGLFSINERKAYKLTLANVEDAAKWYVINDGPPTHPMNTEEVKKTLVPHYLNKWPTKGPIQVTIDTNGKVTVKPGN